MDVMKRALQVTAVLLFTICVVGAALPLFGTNYIPTHDGEYHIIRIVEFARMLGAGYMIPRWAPDMNSGYGIPIFNYHYPLPDYIGSAVRVFTHDAVYAFQMSMGFGYILLAGAAFLWLSALFGTVPALVGALVTAFVPYLFVDTYVRGSIGEVWATAFLLLSLYLLEKKKLVWFGVAYGFLILSHNIMAMLYTPFILGYVFIRNKKAAVWMLAGLGISAFFWVPALLEAKYMVGLNTVNFRQYFVQLYELLIPSWGTGFAGSGSFGNTMSVQMGIAPLLVMIGAVWVQIRQRRSEGAMLWYFIAIVLLAVLFMLPISTPLWELISPLQLMQYPWRLLSFVIPIAGFCAAFWVFSLKNKGWGLVIAILAVGLAASYARPVLYAPRNEAYYMSRPNFTDGTSSMGNSFSTVWTGWKDTRALNLFTTEGGTVSGLLKSSYMDHEVRLTMANASNVTVHTLYFPGWVAFVDGKQIGITYQKDGIIHVIVPKGEHVLRVLFTETTVRKFADGLTILSLAILAVFGYTSSRKKIISLFH